MSERATKAQRVRFWLVVSVVYIALVVAAVLLHDRAPWMGAGAGTLGGCLLLAVLLGWWRRNPSNPDRVE
jgi:protein-S-isoprenylcysteine O-methyltransferase Ste14